MITHGFRSRKLVWGTSFKSASASIDAIPPTCSNKLRFLACLLAAVSLYPDLSNPNSDQLDRQLSILGKNFSCLTITSIDKFRNSVCVTVLFKYIDLPK